MTHRPCIDQSGSLQHPKVALTAWTSPGLEGDYRLDHRRYYRLCCTGLQEECKGWDVSSIVFSPALWPAYHAIMRADFKLFDQYEYTHAGMLHCCCNAALLQCAGTLHWLHWLLCHHCTYPAAMLTTNAEFTNR